MVLVRVAVMVGWGLVVVLKHTCELRASENDKVRVVIPAISKRARFAAGSACFIPL